MNYLENVGIIKSMETPNPLRVVLYERVSTDEQAEGKNIDSQAAENEKYCVSKKFIILRHYQDNGWSGTRIDRPSLDLLLDDAKKNSFDAVVCYSVDRLSRDNFHFSFIVRELEKIGVQILFVNTPTTDDPAGKFMRGIFSQVAEYERLVILQRTRRGKRYKAERRKEFVGYIPPYGYRYSPRSRAGEGKIEIEPSEAEVIKNMFSWVAEDNLSSRGVAKKLAELDIYSRQGNKFWGRSSVLRVLHNENYTGKFYYYRRECIEGDSAEGERRYKKNLKTRVKWRPKSEWINLEFPDLRIVSDRTYLEVQEKLKSNIALSKRNSKHDYLLGGGFLKCARCGSSYYGDMMHGFPYYKDSNKKKTFPLPKKCSSPSISAKKIESKVWGFVTEQILNPDFLISQVKLNKDLFDEEEESSAWRLQKLNSQLKELEDREGRLVHGFETGVLSDDQVRSPLSEIRTKKVELNNSILKVESEIKNDVEDTDVQARIKSFCSDARKQLNTLSFEGRKRLVRVLLKDIMFDGQSLVIRGFIPVSGAFNLPKREFETPKIKV